MATVSSITRQISTLDISSKKGLSSSTTAKPAGHVKQPSQPNVAKLLTKFAAPNAPQQPSKLKPMTSQTSLRNLTNKPIPATTTTKSADSSTTPSPAASLSAKPIDIGTYDGGLEVDDGKPAPGDEAKGLALDSSTLG